MTSHVCHPNDFLPDVTCPSIRPSAVTWSGGVVVSADMWLENTTVPPISYTYYVLPGLLTGGPSLLDRTALQPVWICRDPVLSTLVYVRFRNDVLL